MRTLKICVSLCFLLAVLTQCNKKEEPRLPRSFEDQMGKGLSAWQYVQTPEDYSNLEFFKGLFEKNQKLLQEAASATKIPKTLHYIWLGPRDFPRESVAYVHSWIAKHPGWQVKFWTDRKRPLPHSAMQECLVQNLKFLELEKCYLSSDNWGEKSDILRYEILFQEGGVYVDHDVKCLESFDDLNSHYDLYCGMDMPSPTVLSSSIHVTNNLIASRPQHPIMKRCMDWLAEHWDEIGATYPGKEKEAVIQRIAHRTFSAFGDSVRALASQTTQDMVFPAYFFNAPDDAHAIRARHLYAGTWFENETPFEKMTRERLMRLSKKVNKILLVCGALAGLNVLGIGFLLYSLKKQKIKAG